MAAYSALLTLSKSIDQILPYEQHYSFLCDQCQMQSLHNKLISFQVFLEHIPGKSSDGIDELESRIRDVAYRLEDMVEPILMHSLTLEYQNRANSCLSIQEANTQLPLAAEGRAISRKSFFKELLHKRRVPKADGTDTKVSQISPNLDDILGWCLDQALENKPKSSHLPLTERAAAAFGNCVEEADLLLEEAMKMNEILDNKIVISGTSIHPHSIATTSSFRGTPSTTIYKVGLNHDLNQILDQVSTRRPPTFQVVCIIGMGGIGKTTLARAVFHHRKTVDHFDVRLWATVSQEYNVTEILQGLLLSGKGKQNETVGELIVQVHKQLVGRRYLVILDDVWDEKVWDEVKNAFPDDKKGSRIILTTRLSKFAEYVGSSYAHQMQFLPEEQSWDLLRETVYGHGAACPSEVEGIGRTISRGCRGLPLALVVIGGLLKLNKTRDYWLKIAESTTAEAAETQLKNILSLSYKNLPTHLKACFLYLASFPEDEEIPTKELVRLWCAEGFLKARESKTIEVVAEECLEELVERNMVLVMKKKYDGKIKTSSIHDVLRDLSVRQAKKEKFLYCHGGRGEIDGDTFLRNIKDQRRVSSLKFNPTCSISFNSLVRTFRTEYNPMDPPLLSTTIPHFKLLRVLEKVQWSSYRVGHSLNNLRYIHLVKSGHEESLEVKPALSNLRNLETLIVSGGYSGGKDELILDFPIEIWEMPRLRHLLSEVPMTLPPFPASGLDEDWRIESWSLQTLTGFQYFDFTLSVIRKLQNLKKLEIKYKENAIGDAEKKLRLDNLVNLHNLEGLSIYCSHDSLRVTNIGFPRNLKKLKLRYTYLPWEKMTIIGDSLERLEVLKLDLGSFEGDVWEPTEGGFLRLKYLKIDRLWCLVEWRAESKHFPLLEKLVIMNCSKLKEVPAEIGDIDTLQKLIVKKYEDNDVGAGFERSVRRIRDESVAMGNDSLQVFILSYNQKLHHVDK